MLDDVDRRIIHALGYDIRLSFAKIGAVLGMAEQTVARRYQAMVRGGALRCTALIDSLALGVSQDILRITPVPGSGATLAAALARHQSMSWVNLTASQVMAVHRPRTAGERDRMMTDLLPKTSLVQSMSSNTVLRRYPLTARMSSFPELFDADQISQLEEVADKRFSMITERERDEISSRAVLRLDRDDQTMITMLELDARTSYTKIADGLDWTPARAAHRLRELVDSGVLYLELDVAFGQLGVTLPAIAWGKVPARRLEAAGTAVAALPEVNFVCATTGATNLMASVQCRDTRHLYDVMTQGFGRAAGIDDVEMTPVVRAVKQARAFVNGGRVLRAAAL